MTKRQIDVQVLPAYRATASTAWVRRVAAAALRAGDPQGTAGASILLTNEQALHDLNRRFRGLDEPTDVLAFGRGGEQEGGPEGKQELHQAEASDTQGVNFPDAPGEDSLGDVVVSYPHAEAQAAERSVPTERELALLIVHGVLHLLGHDHAEPGEQAAMQALEAEALDLLFAGAPA